jgi:hypothetical protein
MSRYPLAFLAMLLLLISGCGRIGGTTAAPPDTQPVGPVVTVAPAATPAAAAAPAAKPAAFTPEKYVIVFNAQHAAVALVAPDGACYKVPAQWASYWSVDDRSSWQVESGEHALPPNWTLWDKSAMINAEPFKPSATTVRTDNIGDATYIGIYYVTSDKPASQPNTGLRAPDDAPHDTPKAPAERPKPNHASAGSTLATAV